MSLLSLLTFIATLGPVGYFLAPGTIATILTIPLVYWTHDLIPDHTIYGIFLGALFFACTFLVLYVMTQYKRYDDPSEIVLDEVVGTLITFWGIMLTTKSIIIGVLLFRAFDIIKFGWVKKAESLSSAWGIMCDDVVAALFANLILRALL